MCRKSVKNKLRSARSGFTLTEVMVASSILAFGMIPILKGMTNAHMTASFIEKKTKSLNCAQVKIEEIKARSIYNFDNKFAESNVSINQGYLCNITETLVDANLKNVSISAGFDEDNDNVLDNDEIKITLQTLIARRL